jgi:uncharacterized protein
MLRYYLNQKIFKREEPKCMENYEAEIENIKNQIENLYHPSDIILFDSCAKDRILKNSDIDLCIIIETEDKRALVRDVLLNINYNIELDVVIYTPEE